MGTVPVRRLRAWCCALALAAAVCACRPEAPPAPEREGIVSLAPNLTETVYALGAGDELKAVGRFSDFPPAVRDLPRVGGYLDPDLEKITLLSPALLLLPGQHAQVAEYAAMQQIPVLHVDMDSLETIHAGITKIGEALGREEAAQALRTDMKSEAAALQDAVAEQPRPSVLIITSRPARNLNSLYTVGGDSFVSEIVTLAGGENIYENEAEAYFEASKETVALAAPEVILEFRAGEDPDADEIAAIKTDWQALPTLPAVRNDRIHIITASHALRPGPRILEIARQIAALLHPELDIG